MKPVHTEIYTKYVPIWETADGSIWRGMSYDTSQECETFFEQRVESGLMDKSYRIEQVEVTQYRAFTQPKSKNSLFTIK